MPSRPHPDLRLLTAAEAADRLHCHEDTFRALAKDDAVLKAGRRARGTLVFWTNQAVALYIASLPKDPASSRAERFKKAEPAGTAS